MKRNPDPGGTEFKTPTRIPRTKPAPVSCGESPHNDSDLQQDIIWDATSPSPRRPGTRRKKQTAGTLNISEIVSRIAPKHGRPQAAEPSLQQWIGDSATIPCTPDLQVPRTKRKSPRASSVDGLLKLAKRFDQNMFHPEEVEVGDMDLLAQDIPDFQSKPITHQSKLSASPPENGQPAVNTEPGTDPDWDQQLQDDLDFLFDGPTQNLSRNLSQAPSAPSEDGRKPPESARGAFEDDWENDDLLNDLLALEMNQNPQLCSTQKPPGPAGPVSPREPAGRVGPRVQKENLRPRATFSGNRTQTDLRTDPAGSPAGTGPHRTEPTCQSNTLKPEPQRSRIDPRSSAETFKPDTVDFMDLDLLFSSDPVWDELADDDLLCEMCEDLENQIQNVTARQTPVRSNQRAALQPTHRTCPNRTQTGAGGPSSSRAAPRPANNHRFGFQRPTDPVTMATGTGTGQNTGQTCSSTFNRVGCLLRHMTALVDDVTSCPSPVGKCSAAEIELKKQRALERRNRRLQAQQNRAGIS
uniref:ETAA1 activator of ATR kinase n=1 Tax=Kryptolebias marmoratus TaxID=37003 RepID=A0A3Q3AQY7_KRYMA